MHVLIGIALKSLLIAGLTLGLLEVMKRRSAAERSWVAHIGLLALVLLALAPLVLPNWNVEAPALFGKAPAVEAPAPQAAPMVAAASPAAMSTKPLPAIQGPVRPTISATATAVALY